MDALQVGRSIAVLRKRYGMTQRRLAEHLHVSDKAVSKWERGLSLPDIALLVRMSLLFDTDMETILSGNLDRMQMQWEGRLVLRYAPGILPETLVYRRPAACLQLSYLMLAGIHQITVEGTEEACAALHRLVGTGASYGIALQYPGDAPTHPAAPVGILQVEGLPFVYGKDVTKTFRRILYEDTASRQLVDAAGRSLGISFLRCHGGTPAPAHFERGVIAFPIDTPEALLDAASLMALVEREQGESIGDLHEIARARGLVAARENA